MIRTLRNLHGDVIAGFALLAFSLWYYLHAMRVLTRRAGPLDYLGEGGFPKLLGVVIAVGSIALMAKGLRAMRARGGVRARAEGAGDEDVSEGEERAERAGFDSVLALKMWLLIAGYVLLLPVAGYLVSTAAFAWLGIRMKGPVPAKSAAAFAVGLTLTLYVIFALGLGVALPPGWIDRS